MGSEAPVTGAVLRRLAQRLHARGLRTRIDERARTVDAATLGVGARGPCRRIALRALLRRRGRRGLWWWLLVPGGETGLPPSRARAELVPLAPGAAVDLAAHRVARALVLDPGVAP